ncbi:hypothetical protein Mapa_001904 [Marchantia paleacea]|nr:hypothetical protein Mapa_001904 [Marchantia paleacea]
MWYVPITTPNDGFVPRRRPRHGGTGTPHERKAVDRHKVDHENNEHENFCQSSPAFRCHTVS